MKNLFILFVFLIPSIICSQHTEEIFKIVEEMPLFPGCDIAGDSQKTKSDCSKQQFLEYIYKNLKYPTEARKNKVEGMVIIQFVIDNDGSINDAKIVRDIGNSCGQAALEVVNSMSDLMTQDTITTFDAQTFTEQVRVISRKQLWRPGYQRGKAVKVLYTIPVRFKLQDDDNKLDDVIEEHDHQSSKTRTNYPPEFSSYQQYKEKVLVPALVKEVFKVDPIESSKVVGNIIPYGKAIHPLLKKMGDRKSVV